MKSDNKKKRDNFIDQNDAAKKKRKKWIQRGIAIALAVVVCVFAYLTVMPDRSLRAVSDDVKVADETEQQENENLTDRFTESEEAETETEETLEIPEDHTAEDRVEDDQKPAEPEEADVTEAGGETDASKETDVTESEEEITIPDQSDRKDTEADTNDGEGVTAEVPETERETKTEQESGQQSEQEQAQEPAQEQEQTESSGGTLRYETAAYSVSLIYGADAGIPEGAGLMVREITEKNKAYDSYVGKVEDSLSGGEQIASVQLFDITIVADGREIQPKAPVEVRIDTPEMAEEAVSEEVKAVHFDENNDAVEVLDASVEDQTVAFEAEGFSVYAIIVTTIEKQVLASDGKNYRISMECGADAGVPGDAQLEVTELDGDEYEYYLGCTASAMDAAGFEYARIFDISITDRDGRKIEPSAAVSVSIELLDTDAAANDFSVVHFEGKEEAPAQITAKTDGNTVSFDTESFSAYAIVQGPSALPENITQITTMAGLKEFMSAGVYIGTTSGYYLTNETAPGSQDAATTGIVKTNPAQNYPPEDKAGLYYFETVNGSADQFYAYCFDNNGEKQYVRNTGDANLTFTDTENRTAFTVLVDNNGRFRFQNGNRYWNMWNGAKGNHIAAWTTANDGNNYFYVWHCDDTDEDPYGLDGAVYGLMNWTGGLSGRAMMAEISPENRLRAKSLTVMSKTGNNESKLAVPADIDISLWKFEWIEDDNYYVSTDIDGSRQYLKIEKNKLSLVSKEKASAIQVIPGSGTHEGEICLKAGTIALSYSGKLDNGFGTGGSAGTEWLTLTEPSELTSDYFLPYSASKVGVSDENVTNGSRIIVYTRVWNDQEKKYEFYAIDHDGSLVRCFESGDDIQWTGSRLNTMLWNFVEYYWEGTTEPNYYYELYNQYSEQYIAPQMTDGQTLSDEVIGINMNGRRDGKYYSKIVAWDDKNYAYVGLKADVKTGKVVSCPRSEADDFYFAVMQDIPADDTLHTISTVDSKRNGITMRLANFDTRKNMSDFLGSDAGGAVDTTDSNLLSTALGENGYPKTKAGKDLSDWFAQAPEVNHLFVQSTYSATGYYEYDSTQNFARLDGDDFVVYKEIGTVNSSGVHYQHGQFFPYNDIKAGTFASTSPKNLTTAGGKQLPESDPRKYEQLYLVDKPDYYLGMEIEASFMQTPNGEDDWGHDIIYEFTGDDDFWLYVDGELIIDLGGIHNALSGSVNYKTGDVYVNGTHHTLRELFESNYKARNPGADKKAVNKYLAGFFEEGETVFKDYTTHTMKIFYLERGAGASNLHMRFNLASVKPGTVELSKKLSGVDGAESVLAEFPYQIKYKKKDGKEYYLYNAVPDSAEKNTDSVFYKDTVKPVTYYETFEADGITYRDVFMLDPGQTAVIGFPEDAESYSIVECGVNTDVYRKVEANGKQLNGKLHDGAEAGSVRRDYETGYESTAERARVTYTNDMDPDALRTLTVRKQLYDETGENLISAKEDQTTFNFRLHLGTEFEKEPQAADMYTYHVKDPEGNYCTWNAPESRFVSTKIKSYSELSDAQKTAASFTTSGNGSVSKIPVGYTVEVRNVLAGTKFKVVERPDEIPDGYSFQKYQYYSNGIANSQTDGDLTDEMAGVSDTVVARQDPHVDICNLKGWGMRVNKVWTDADYMMDRNAAYFAVYTKDDSGQLKMVDGTLRQMPYGGKPESQTLYWYFDHLPVKGTSGLQDYVIREVTISNHEPEVDEEGVVTDPGEVSIVKEAGKIVLDGMQKGETDPAAFEYTVSYQEGEISQESNVRVDTVTNDRPGIILKKTDWSGNALAGAFFELQDADGSLIGTFVSDSDGLITTAFLGEDKTYTLKEIRNPKAYLGLQTPMTISQKNGTVTVEGPAADDYILKQAGEKAMASITIKNRSASIKAVKTDGDTKQPLEGVTFALYKQHTVDGVISFGTEPMSGYEALVTDADGNVPKIDNTLPAGTYELREVQTKAGYVMLSEYITFTISDTRKVTLDAAPAEVELQEPVNAETGAVDYTIRIPNSRLANILLKKTDTDDKALKGAGFSLAFYENDEWNDTDEYGQIDMTERAEITLGHLPAGRYRLTETKAPAGYEKLDVPVYFMLEFDTDGSALITVTDENGTKTTNDKVYVEGSTITVRNAQGVSLPSTGGRGTRVFFAAGILLVAGAGLLLWKRRRTI